MKRINFDTIKTCFYVFIILNILTMPLSPHNGGGLMSKEAYAPIMNVKFAIMGAFAIWGIVLLVMHWKFLTDQKKARKESWQTLSH